VCCVHKEAEFRGPVNSLRREREREREREPGQGVVFKGTA